MTDTYDDVDIDTGEMGPEPTPPEPTVVQENWLLQASFKTPAGALINVRGRDYAGLKTNLEAIQALTPLILEAEKGFTGLGTAMAGLGASPVAPAPQQGAGGPGNGGYGQWSAPQQGQGQAPAGPAPTCDHGMPAKYVKGGISSKTGRPYPAFWACAMPRGQECRFRVTA